MAAYVVPMERESDKQPSVVRLAPERTFVVQLRSDSDLAQRQVHGRVEHVVSGESEPFASLDALLAFMNRHLSDEPTFPGEDAHGPR